MRITVIAVLLIVTLSGCVSMTGVEHTVYGGIQRGESGGEVYSASPSGHQEQYGGWNVGSAIKTIWSVK